MHCLHGNSALVYHILFCKKYLITTQYSHKLSLCLASYLLKLKLLHLIIDNKLALRLPFHHCNNNYAGRTALPLVKGVCVSAILIYFPLLLETYILLPNCTSEFREQTQAGLSEQEEMKNNS